jgi:hypothetical protein
MWQHVPQEALLALAPLENTSQKIQNAYLDQMHWLDASLEALPS